MARIALGIAIAAVLIGAAGLAAFAFGVGPGGWGFCPGWGVFGGPWRAPGSGVAPLSDEEVIRIAQQYIASYRNPDLELAEIMAFDNHYYAQARERSTGRYAFEFLIDPYTGAVHPEPGPNMMWNTKYGHMAGWGWMMGRGPTQAEGEMPISPEEAVRIAQQFLDATGSGLQADEEADAFYGYYTIHTLRDGQIVGMLSVNGYTAAVWPHTWHGRFLRIVFGHEDEGEFGHD